MSEWKTKTLGEVTEKIFSGGTPNTTTEKYWNGELCWLSSGETKNRFITDTEKKITQYGVDNSSTRKAHKYDVVVASAGQGHTRGQVSLLLIDTFINQSVVSLRADNINITPLWLFYNLSNRYEEMRQLSDSHSSRGSLTTKILGKMPISFPPVEIQKELSKQLFSIDQKIQLNTQTNQTLEQIAQAIYKSWFVDYEPTRAKAAVLAAGGSKAEAETAAMRAISSKTAAELVALAQNHPARYQQLADLAAAFPAALVPTDDFGEIPEGWEVKPLPEIIDFMEGPGIRNWQYTDAEDGVRFINIRCIQNGDIVLDKANKITKEEAFGKYAHFQLREDDIVVSASGTLGRFAFIRKEHLPLCLNTSVIRFRPIKQKSTIGFIEGFIAGQLQYELETRASGSAQRNFGPMHLKQISIVTPEYELLSLHQYYISELYHKRKFTLAENDNLLHIRDLLLPKLLKGDV